MALYEMNNLRKDLAGSNCDRSGCEQEIRDPYYWNSEMTDCFFHSHDCAKAVENNPSLLA